MDLCRRDACNLTKRVIGCAGLSMYWGLHVTKSKLKLRGIKFNGEQSI